MTTREWKIGIVGTFDVHNYGDLLFPLIAALELESRLGSVEIVALGYHDTPAPTWPFKVRSVADLPDIVHELDGLLVGGGYIIRFDRDVAPGYAPPLDTMHHPTSYWLIPALLAIQSGIPVAWNAPGMNDNEIPSWADVLMEAALQLSSYVAVRDEASRARLERYSTQPIGVVPDTALALAKRCGQPASPDLIDLRSSVGLTRPYVVVQASVSSARFVDYVRRNAADFGGLQFVALPLSPGLGDHVDHVADLPEVVNIPPSTHPFLIADVIQGAEAVVGISFHLALTALTAGVAAFSPQGVSGGRLAGLSCLGDVVPIFEDGEPDTAAFQRMIGRTAVPPAVTDALRHSARHWDDIADVVRTRKLASDAGATSLLQRLPHALESAADASSTIACASSSQERTISQLENNLITLQNALDESRRLAAMARGIIKDRSDVVSAMRDSRSWRVTGPLRQLSGRVSSNRRGRNPILDTHAILNSDLREHPYPWTVFDDLFSAADIRDLVDTFPRDSFKFLADYAGEKDYEYEARQLTPMGAAAVVNAAELSQAWVRLGADLTSAEYRTAMSLLVARDLTDAVLEVNVFHYGPRANLGPHTDLEDKIVTHIIYFNDAWDPAHGGHLTILGSQDPVDIVAEVPPTAGTSAIIVRCDNSWHAVTRVSDAAGASRRSVTATFYRPGAHSTMWPAGDQRPLHRYVQS